MVRFNPFADFTMQKLVRKHQNPVEIQWKPAYNEDHLPLEPQHIIFTNPVNSDYGSFSSSHGLLSTRREDSSV